MKIKHILLLITLIMISQGVFAQYSQDGYQFSTAQRPGSARFKAIGNATTALGGDVSSTGINPAGLGFFSKSEFSFTPEFNGRNTGSKYFDSDNSTEINNLNLNNLGVVFTTRGWVESGKDNRKGILSFSIGLNYNRTNDFYRHNNFAGRNPNSSIADKFAEDATTQDLLTGSMQEWAFKHFLIDEVTDNKFESNTALGSDQTNDITSSGGQNEFNISFGANHSNRFYFGAGIGFASLRFNKTNIYTEIGNQWIDNFDYELTRIYDQETKGSGVNFKLGMIFKPSNTVRLGASIISPTWYKIHDNTTTSLTTDYTESKTYKNGPEEYPQNYNLRTPLKLNGGLAFFIKKSGFISADIEYVDYAGMHIGSDYGYNASKDNRELNRLYQSTVNARVGAEAKIQDFAIRAGYSYLGNPQKGIGSPTNSISGGLGYRFGNYYFDLTYVNTVAKPTIYPYELDPAYSIDKGNPFFSPEANLKETTDNIFLTFGIRF